MGLIQLSVTGNLITMLRLLKNTTFSTAFPRVSDITLKMSEQRLKFQTLNCRMHCVTQKLREKMMSGTNTRSGSGEKIPYYTEHRN